MEVKQSDIHGYGVFATRDIERGEIIEECYYIELSTSWKLVDETLKHFVFGSEEVGPLGMGTSAVLGYGMIYNHSINNNVDYKQERDRMIYSYFASKNIRENEELTIDYGKNSYSCMRMEVKKSI